MSEKNSNVSKKSSRKKTSKTDWPWCEPCHSWHDPANPTCVLVQPPKQIDEWRLDEKGRLDDIVVHDVTTFRLERMSKDQWWIGLYKADGTRQAIMIYRKGKKVVADKFE